MVDECGLADASPSHNCHDIDLRVCPHFIQQSDILLAPKNITSCNRQSRYRNFLRSQSCWRLTSSDRRSAGWRLLEALTSDSTPPVDSISYRRDGLQKLGRVLKSPCRVFLKESL